MKFTQQDLISIVEKASTINDRLSDRFIPDDLQSNGKSIDMLLEHWCLLCTQGDGDEFAKRLAWDNLDIDRVRRVLGNVKLADEKSLPSWAETLREVLQTNVSIEEPSSYRYLEPENPLSFEEFYLPFVEVGIQKLINRVADNYQLLSPVAQITLERSLLKEIALISLQTLEFEFSLFSALKQSGLMRLFAQVQGNSAKTQYQNFIKTVTGESLLSFLNKYSVLARLLTTKLDFWVENTAEFIDRLASDLPIINSTFAKNFIQVAEIETGLSDAHNQGKSVIKITFICGIKLIYKPRTVGLEAAYFDLLGWFNQHNCPLPFKLLKVINCNTYGWVEYAEHLPCESEIAAQRYYQRAGMLICLLYILGETDGHYENLIASGEYPVLIDTETLIHPDACRFVEDGQELAAEFLANRQIWRSVLRSRLLPTWEFKADRNIAYDLSALGGGKEENFLKVRKWKDINTDNMAGYYEFVPLVGANTVSLNGIILSANDYVNQIVDGCQQMYHFLLQWRVVLLANDSPLAALANQQVRIMFRDTEIYGQLMRKTLQPKFLQSGVDRSIELDVLSRAFLMVDTKPEVWAVKQMEIQGIEQLDFPYFSTASDSTDFILSSELRIKNFFRRASYQQVIFQLHQLSDADLVQQTGLIRAALYSRVVGKMGGDAATSEITSSLDDEEFPLLTSAEIVEEAIAIGKEIAQRAIQGANGSATWISLAYIPNAQRLQLQTLEYGLYDGTSGIALFLAALAKVTGETEYRDLALAALQPLAEILENEKSQFVARMVNEIGIGGASGLASIVYALVRVSQFVDAPELLNIAKVIASLITPEIIERDRTFDILAGSAGAILGLLTLHSVIKEPVILDTAIACGNHLLDRHSTCPNSGLKAWQTVTSQLLTGFSHGAAGIAYALLRLYQSTSNPMFLKAAQEAQAYEASVFSASAKNWPDLRSNQSDSEPNFMTSWCHGAPGIGLARLGSLEILKTDQILQEIANAADTTRQFGLQSIDHLCCGNFGRIELLIVAAQKLSCPDLSELAQKQSSYLIARAKHLGHFSLFPQIEGDFYSPSFFRGTAGIGYQLLRLAYPTLLPSVLLWD